MAIEINLDIMLIKRKMTLTQLSQKVGVSVTNLSLFKTGKVRGIRFATLASICRALNCQPGDLLACTFEDNTEKNHSERQDNNG